MPFHHGDLRQVARRVGDGQAVSGPGLNDQRSRHDLSRLDPDHADPPIRRRAEVVGRKRRHANTSAHPVGHGRLRDRDSAALLSGHPAPFDDERRPERLEVGDGDDVGEVPGGDRAVPMQAVISSGEERPHDDRVIRRAPQSDGLAHEIAVVGAQQAVARAMLEHQWKERFEVPRRGAFADHDPHPEPSLLQSFLVRRALVVAPHAGREIRVEGPAGEARRVPVDVAVIGSIGGLDLRQRSFRAARDAGKVHHLGDA